MMYQEKGYEYGNLKFHYMTKKVCNLKLIVQIILSFYYYYDFISTSLREMRNGRVPISGEKGKWRVTKMGTIQPKKKRA